MVIANNTPNDVLVLSLKQDQLVSDLFYLQGSRYGTTPKTEFIIAELDELEGTVSLNTTGLRELGLRRGADL
jgi:hypothetical protein